MRFCLKKLVVKPANEKAAQKIKAAQNYEIFDCS
jgi:hypothetical protein